MTEPTDERIPVRYFCTAGNGMEYFVVDEVYRKLAAENVSRLQGKVIFNSSANINTIIDLKAAERLFLLLKHDTPLKLPTHINQAKAASLLQSKLKVDTDEWTNAAMLWGRLQRELKDRKTSDSIPSALVGVKRKREEPSKIEELGEPVCDGETKIVTVQEGGESMDSRINHEQDGLLESKRQRSESKGENTNNVSFRISCKCNGTLTQYFSTQDVSKVLGSGLTRLLGWRVDLRNPQLEVNVNLTDDHCLLGIPLTKLPLANRTYIKTTGLRSTVAWAMASLAQIQPGSCVLDPMCGVGTILIEAAQEHQDAYFLGKDIDDGQLLKAKGNIAYADLEDRIQLLKASSMELPLKSASVDAVVCDLPFGRKFGTKMDIAVNLPLILTEMERVLSVGGTLVLLLSPQLSCLMKKLHTQEGIKSNSVQEKKPQTEMQDCPSVAASFTNQLFGHSHINGSGTTQEPERLCVHNWTSPLSSLRHETTLRVSLGAIDGLIHKYVKTT